MTFASPLWLVGLLPWLGVALYLLWGRRKLRDVPFLDLWRGPAAVEHAKWKVSAPPVALAMAVLAMLAATLGVAKPGARWGAGGNSSPIAVVVDRGITMSARGANDLRFRETGRDAGIEIASVFGGDVPVDAWVVPARGPGASGSGNAERFSGSGAWSQSLDHLPATAVDSAQAVRENVRRALAAGRGPVVVVSDARIGITDPRLVQVTPTTPLRNVGIALLAARASPRSQVMVRVRNDSPIKSATLEVNFGATGDAPIRQTIDLPLAGGERDFFLDARHLGPVVSAALVVPDDLEADNMAWLTREAAWPRVELTRPPGGLARLVDVYAKLHRPGDGSRIVRVVSRAEDLGPGESGIILDSGTGAGNRAVRPTRVVPNPITDAARDWMSLELPAGDGKPPAGFTSILLAGDQVLAAVHEGLGTSRQAWVGLDPAGWADRPQYVAFWAAAFDWAGGVGSQGERYVSHPLDEFDGSWKPTPGDQGKGAPGTWPGLFQRGDGARRAFDASPPNVAALAPANPAWRRDLARWRSVGPGYRNLSAIPMLASAAFILLAAATWRKARQHS